MTRTTEKQEISLIEYGIKNTNCLEVIESGLIKKGVNFSYVEYCIN